MIGSKLHPLSAGTEGYSLSGLYLLTNPARLNLPGTKVPAGIAPLEKGHFFLPRQLSNINLNFFSKPYQCPPILISVNKSGYLDTVELYFTLSVFSDRISLNLDITLTFLYFANLSVIPARSWRDFDISLTTSA